MTDAQNFLAYLEARAKAATPGPWANTDNVQEMFGVEPYDWWKVYAKNRKGLDHPMTVCSMTCRATEEEEAAARINEPMRDPGQAGKDAAFIAAANPETVKRLVAMVRYLAIRAGKSPNEDPLCAYHELDLKGKKCPLLKDGQGEISEDASYEKWYDYVFGDGYEDEITCEQDTSKCWLHAAYINTEPTS